MKIHITVTQRIGAKYARQQNSTFQMYLKRMCFYHSIPQLFTKQFHAFFFFLYFFLLVIKLYIYDILRRDNYIVPFNTSCFVMGSCISKCIPKNSSFQEVEDDDDVKHAVSPAEKPPVSPSPSSASLTSLSSSSCSNTYYSLTSSLSSSSCSSKDRSFSNEFLRSCAKENQHVIVMKPGRGNLERTSSVRQRQTVGPFLSSPNAMPLKPSTPRMHVGGSTPKKRPRSNSPTLVRQKSFRKDPQPLQGTTSTCHFPNRALRSPSPSRRFTADGQGKMDISPLRHGGVLKGNSINSSAATGVGKQNFKPASPNCQPRGVEGCSKGNTVNSKGDEGGKGTQEMDTMLIEDINNPLIALDCFIFL